MSYYSNVNPDLLRFIPPDAKIVLEIGCGDGALCEAYRRVNPGVEWYGIEPDRGAVDIASKHLSGVCATTAEECWKFGMVEGWEDFDCLICGDVLEHMEDPWSTLTSLVENLKPGAQVLACIPNVGHWTIIRDLMDGKWEYQDSGLLDRTHLRFFTLGSIRKMFADAGLQVFEIVGRDLFNEGIKDWYESYIDHEGITDGPPKEWRAYQYVVRAIKPVHRVFGSGPSPIIEPIPKLRIHGILAEACCARPRIFEPFAQLGTIPGVKCTVGRFVDAINADVLLVQRPRQECDAAFRQILLGAYSVIVVEIDDLPEAIGVDPLWLRGCHAVQCSTDAIAEIVRKYNPNVMVFPNQIAELWPMKSAAIGSYEPELVCAWQNRESDWAPIIDVLNDVLRDYPLVEVRVIHDQKFYDALETDNKKFTPFCSYENYRHRLRQGAIALLPLEDTPFNRAKSDLKFLECAAEGVAVLMSTFAVDQISPAANDSTFEYDSPDRFEFLLRRLVKRSDYRASSAKAAYAYVRDNRLLSQHYRAYYEWYQSLLARKSELDVSLFKRVPELAGVTTNA